VPKCGAKQSLLPPHPLRRQARDAGREETGNSTQPHRLQAQNRMRHARCMVRGAPVFHPTEPLPSANAYSVSSGARPHPAVPGQASLILGVPNHALRAGRKFRLSIRAMSCFSVPACSGCGPTGSAHGCIRGRRRQRQAESQDSARERASVSAVLFTIRARKDGHCKDPSDCHELPQETHLRGNYSSAPRLPDDYALRDPIRFEPIKIE
jgi:hypothetical protein